MVNGEKVGGWLLVGLFTSWTFEFIFVLLVFRFFTVG